MIKNVPSARRGAAVLAFLFAAGCGCSGVQAGRLEPLQGVVELEERRMGFEVGGRLARVDVTEGERVTAGAEIARLDDSLESLAREARAADLAAAEAQLSLLRRGARAEELRAAAAGVRAARSSEEILGRSLARQRELAARGASPELRSDELEAQLAQTRAHREEAEERRRALGSGARAEEIMVAESRVVAARAGVRLADERLARYRLRSAHAGTVLHLHVEEGEVVSPGAPVVTMADVSRPFVDVFVPQSRAGGIRAGMAASVRIDAEKRNFRARVEHVGRRAEFTPRFLFSDRERPNIVLRVRVRVDDPSGELLAGVPAFVTVPREASVGTR